MGKKQNYGPIFTWEDAYNAINKVAGTESDWGDVVTATVGTTIRHDTVELAKKVWEKIYQMEKKS
jgi:hypothetical protein